MRRRDFVLGVGAAAFAWPALAQKKAPRIAALFNGIEDIERPNVQMLTLGLADHGYADGKNVVLDLRHGYGQIGKLPEIVADMIAKKPDILLLQGSQPIWAGKKATSTIPIIMISVADPVGQGLIGSLARPGGNLTGFSIATESDVAKRLQILREVLPKSSRFAYFTNLSNTAMPKLWDSLNESSKRMGMTLVLYDCRNMADLEKALGAISKQNEDGVLIEADALLSTSRRRIIEVLQRERMPSMWASPFGAPEGGMMSYGSNFSLNWRAAGRYINRILRGANPADIPVEQPTHVQLIINRRVARRLNIVIPQPVLARADWVIE